MSEWDCVTENLTWAIGWLDQRLKHDPDDTQARLWRDHLANDYKSISLHAQKAQQEVK